MFMFFFVFVGTGEGDRPIDKYMGEDGEGDRGEPFSKSHTVAEEEGKIALYKKTKLKQPEVLTESQL